MTIGMQIIWLFVLAIPVACVSWTVTHEEVFREPREYCARMSKEGKSWISRKFFYLFTCEYCFSHYVTIAFLIFADYTLLYTDWRGYVVAGFALVWIANIYMNLYQFVRASIREEKATSEVLEQEAHSIKQVVKQNGN